MERFRTRERTDAVDRLEAIFETAERARRAPRWPCRRAETEATSPSLRKAIESARTLITKAERIAPTANAEDAAELKAMLVDLRGAIDHRSEDEIKQIASEVEDLVFYLEDN